MPTSVEISLQPEQARFLFEATLPVLEREAQITKNIFEAIPFDKGDYRPDAISKTALELAWHMIATEGRFLDGIINGGFDFSPRPRPEALRTSADFVAFYAEQTESAFEKVKQLSGEQLATVIDFRAMVSQPAVDFLSFAMRHTIHHRGQLSMYLRPMGAKVPSMYGESYDAAEARKAALASA